MKKDWFKRPTRMIHKFGELEKIDDPFGERTWDLKFPQNPVRDLHTPPCEIHEYGEYNYRPEPSAVSKTSGTFASLSGPAPDPVEGFSRPWPVGTKRRVGPPRTDK